MMHGALLFCCCLTTAATGLAIPRVQLGQSSLKVSEVTLGTMTWGRQNSLEEGIEQLDCAVDEYGLNFIDTAEMYPVPTEAKTQGATDRTIGEWLKRRGRRDDVVIASKVCGRSDRIDWLREDGRSAKVDRSQILESVDDSLKRLGTDYIDLLQIHWPDRYVPLFGSGEYESANERETVSFAEQLGALQELVKSGKVREIGLSNETPYGVCKFVELAEREGFPRIASIQNSYSLLVRSDFESGLTETCSLSNVGLLAYSPLAGGILSGKYATAAGPPVDARLTLFPGFMDRYQQSAAREAVAEYGKIAKRYDLSPSELALKWCYTRPHVASTIIGATSIKQLRENIEAFSAKLPEEALQEVAEVYKRYRDPSKQD